MDHGFLEEVFRADGRHFRATTLPLGLHEDFTEDVSFFFQLLLKLLLLLGFNHLLFLSLA